MKNVPFPSIVQFRNVAKELKKVTNNPVEFVGYTKIHGTNASILVTEDTLYAQSKNRLLKVGDDNAGFAAWLEENYAVISGLIPDLLINNPKLNIPFEICGEWAGASIQKNVAITGVDKFFAVFGLANVIEDKLEFIEHDESFKNHDIRMFNIADFGKWEVVIDPENPAEAQNTLVDLTIKVEENCPVGAYFGISGVGEGIVWHPKYNPDRHLWFKVKGEKHSISKVKTLAAVDPEKLKGYTEFVEYAVTIQRMNQAIQETGEPQNTNIPAFLKWINADIIKEESDVLIASGFEFKEVVKSCNAKALAYYKSLMV